MVYSMGDRGEDILSSFTLSEDDKKKYNVVLEQFEKHFIKKRNVIYARAKFNQRHNQKECDPVKSFITLLYSWQNIAILALFRRNILVTE